MPTPDEQLRTMVESLKEKTGRTLDGWRDVVAKSGLEKHGEIVALLKSKHGVTHGYANTIVHLLRSAAEAPASGDALVAAAFRGKEELRPLYDQLVATVRGFGPDVELAPKKGYVSLRRRTQFGLLQPSTKSRLDVGLKLKGVAPAGRLEASGGFNAMVTHRVRVESEADLDAELAGWLRRAYDEA